MFTILYKDVQYLTTILVHFASREVYSIDRHGAAGDGPPMPALLGAAAASWALTGLAGERPLPHREAKQ